MQRIYPQRVRLALQTLSLTPTRVFFRQEHWRCAFGLAAVVEQRLGNLDYVGKPVHYLATCLQLSAAYVAGFNAGWESGWWGPPPAGFDGKANLQETNAGSLNLGWWDGAKAAEHCGLTLSVWDEAKLWTDRYCRECHIGWAHADRKKYMEGEHAQRRAA